MAWQDRDYNRSGFGGAGDYIANPSGILQLSVPFGTWFGVRVRLHFWLLLAMVFLLVRLFDGGSLMIAAACIAILVGSLLLHDFGHRLFAHWGGGYLNEFMLWPAGGMVFPSMPNTASAMFIGYAGGLAANLAAWLASSFAYFRLTGQWVAVPLNPLLNFGLTEILTYVPGRVLEICLLNCILINWGLVLVNLLPYFWFDGGYLLQAMLRPLTGQSASLSITCIFAMILAVPMFALALVHQDIVNLFIWALLFSSAYTARTQMAPEGEEYAAAVSGGAGVQGRIQSGRWPKKASLRAAAKKKQLEEKIDAILAKVSAKGMHSLTWSEKRILRKASERLK